MKSNSEHTLADAVRAGDAAAIAQVTSGLIRPREATLVFRPWGGRQMRAYKGMSAEQGPQGSGPWGEAFEICGDTGDPEASRFPSVIELFDGSTISLPELLKVAAAPVLGEQLAKRVGSRFPLLPKTLDVAQLLSVQAHPEGNTEAYVIIEAEPGATICLGFRRDVDASRLRKRLHEGRCWQQSLLQHLDAAVDQDLLQQRLGVALSQRGADADALLDALGPLMLCSVDTARVREAVQGLKTLYWDVLDMVNQIPVRPGQVIHNANPPRVVDKGGRQRSAEVHALGNSRGKRILALEIRCPGTTYRAWDHVRFPMRDIHIDEALGALNLEATRPEEFDAEPKPISGEPGIWRSIASEYFTVDHLRPCAAQPVERRTLGQASTLHAVKGQVEIMSLAGTLLGRLKRGESALLPACIPGISVTSLDADVDAEVIQATLPAA